MSKTAKIVISVVVIVLLVGLILGLIFIFQDSPRRNTSLTSRLDTPTNVRVDLDNRILSFDPVENAENYQIYVNGGQNVFNSNQTQVDISAYIRDYGLYSFQVRALHSTPDYNSYLSDTAFVEYSTTLLAPSNLSLDSNSILYWSSVANAVSYNIIIASDFDSNGDPIPLTTEPLRSDANNFDFSTILNQYPYSELNFIAFYVQATSVNLITGEENRYVHASEYSEPTNFFRSTTIRAPVIELDPDATNFAQGTPKSLVWDIDSAVDEYEVYIDGMLATTILTEGLASNTQYSLDLSTLTINSVPVSDTLGSHSIYIRAIPKTNPNFVIASQDSEVINYTVTHTLSTPDANSVSITKEGNNLVIRWDPVSDINPYDPNTPYVASSYNLVLLANSNIETGDFFDFLNVTGLLTTMYTIPLDDLVDVGSSFCVRIQAVREGNQYIYNSDYSEESAPYNAVSQMQTPADVRIIDANGVYSMAWREVSGAQAGYLVRVHEAIMVGGTLQLGSIVLTQTVTSTSLQISDYMNDRSLSPGLYAVDVITRGYSVYFTDSNPSDPVSFDYKVRLSTPVIQSPIVRTNTDVPNKFTFTVNFTYVEGAQYYNIQVDNNDAGVIAQPAVRPESGYITDTLYVTNYINGYNVPGQYRVTVQAIVRDNVDDLNYINSVPSAAVSVVNSYYHSAPTNLLYEQTGNTVAISWDPVDTVTNSGGTYSVEINGVLIPDLTTTNTYVADISEYLSLGQNSVSVYSSASGQLYIESERTTVNLNYSYVLSGSTELIFSAAPDSREVQITIPSLNRYVTHYYLEFSTGETRTAVSMNESGKITPGLDAVINVDFDCLPLHRETTITVYAGRIDATTYQENLTSCNWDTTFTNALFIDAPAITLDESSYILTLTITAESIPYTQAIEWRLSGTTGVNYTAYITDLTSTTYTLNLRQLNLINDGKELLVGDYNIYAAAIASANNMRSPDNSRSFRISNQLATPTNFITADDNSYLQWDYVEDAVSYEVKIDGVIYDNFVFGEYTAVVDGEYRRVVRMTIPSNFFTEVRSYNFEITALPGDNAFYEPSEAGLFEWEFSNQIPSPIVSVIQRNNQDYLQIVYNSLVANYELTCSLLPGLNTTIPASNTDGFVYYNIENLMTTNSAPAGEYTFEIVANPVDTSIYTPSRPTSVLFTWYRMFDTPTITVSQDMAENAVVIMWNQIVAELIGGETISPSEYEVVVTGVNDSLIYVSTSVYTNSYAISSEELSRMASGDYFVSVTAIGNGAMLDSYTGSIRFIYQEQLNTPVIVYTANSGQSYSTLVDDNQVFITLQNPDSRANQFELRVELLDSNGDITKSEIFDSLTWQNNQYTLYGDTHFADRGIYQISVRHARNDRYAPSAWSDPLILYVAKTFDVASNITLSNPSGTDFVVTFDELTIPGSLTTFIGYTATVAYNNAGATDSINFLSTQISNGQFSFTGDEDWVTAFTTPNSRFTITISAVTSAVNCSPSNLGLEVFNFAPNSSTVYTFVVGEMNAPSGFIMSADGSNITISWVGDQRYPDKTYDYNLYVVSSDNTTYYLSSDGSWVESQQDLSTTTESITFALPSDAVYGIHLSIMARSNTDKTSSARVNETFINTRDLPEITGVSISYNEQTGYTATWNDVLQNSAVFTGGAYTFRINGQDITMSGANISGGTVSVTVPNEIVETAILVSRTAIWTVVVSDTMYNGLIAYRGQTFSNSLNLPVIISSAPENLSIDGTTVTWDPVMHATRYEIYISLTENGEVYNGLVDITNSTTYNINALIADLTAGEYYVVVRVAEDVAQNVYVSPDVQSSSVTYTVRTQISGITNLNVTSMANAGGVTYVTTITWYYPSITYPVQQGEGTEPLRFTVYLTDSAGNVQYVRTNVAPNAGDASTSQFYYEYRGESGYLFTFAYLDGTRDDVSRSMTAGDCVVSVVVCGNDIYLDSAPVNRTFQNKFAVAQITDDSLFAVLPDAFVSEGSIVDHEITDPSADLQSYENSFGFNEKYLIIRNDMLSYAQYFKVYIATSTNEDGEDVYTYVGTIENHATELTYDAFINTTYKLRLPNTVAGINKIKLIPYGDENYYFYLSGGAEVPLTDPLAESSTSSFFERELYLRNDAPLLTELSIDVGFSDSPTNHDVNRVNIVFRNAELGATYRVVPHYKDYYNGYTDTVGEAFLITLGTDDFDGNVPLGLAVYDFIKHYGPFEFWFEVQNITDTEFRLNSHTATTPNSFIFTTKLMEFAPERNGDSSVNSLVTEITADNEDDFAKNGSLTWTLPTHPYSIRVQYVVSVSDLSQEFGALTQYQRHTLSYTAYLNVIVSSDGTITYTIDQNDSGYFTLDTPNNRLIFDMRGYFNNTIRVGDTGAYYLAGTYEYMITATAFDKNGQTIATRIYSPNSYGTLESMQPYTYRDIPFPFAPTDVVLNMDGVLSWGFNDTIYGSNSVSTSNFKILVRTWDEAHETSTDYFIEVSNTTTATILDSLIAGGGARNDVYIYTTSPMEYYLDSEMVKVNTDSLPTSTGLPELQLNWSDHRSLGITLTHDISQAIYDDIINNDNEIWITVSLLKLANWSVGDPTPAPGRSYDDVRNSGDALAEIVWDQPVDSQFYSYIPYYPGITQYNFDFISELVGLAGAGEIVSSTWLSGGDSLSSGYYYVKVSLSTSSSSYQSSIIEGEKMVREVWRSSTQDASIEGPHLTTKLQTEVANPVNGNDKLWGEDQYKNAYLTIYVNSISQVIDGVTYYRLPETISVTARLYTNPGYDIENYYTETYSIPDPTLLGTADTYLDPDNPDVRITRVYNNGVLDNTRFQITIDIHLLFDSNISAGVYHIYWVLNGDEVGDSSSTADPYRLTREVCHYVTIPRPILDYRLDYTGTNYSNYVLNWTLTPDQYTYQISDNCDYNVNIFAFEQTEDGTYASDILYNSLTPEEQAEFYSSEMQDVYFTNNPNVTTKLLNYSNISELNGRDCYIHLATDNGLHLTPNKSYKIYIFLSNPGWNDSMSLEELNQQYYLPSDTSLGVEYVYKQVSGQHQNGAVTVLPSGYPLENTEINDGKYYNFSSTQPDQYNNAFELYIYNTQDPRASSNTNWTALQEAEGTYLAHWIIGTRDNVAGVDSEGRVSPQSLYILYDYEDKLVNSGNWDYTRSIGTLADRTISFDDLTLTELLYNDLNQNNVLDKRLTPTTYYCKIKTWINNNEVNANAPTDDATGLYYEDDVIYSEKWIRNNVPYVKNADGTINEEMVANFYNSLQEYQITVPYLDINSLNPSYYFVFEHHIKYAMPYLADSGAVEILNTADSSDYTGYSSLGATDGYIIADSDYGYYYRIWLENVYTLDPLIRDDKEIYMDIGYTNYDGTDGGSSGTGNAGNMWTWTQTPVRLKIHYVDDPEDENFGRAYVELRHDSPESSLARQMFDTLDSYLPNVVSFNFRAVNSEDVAELNAGGENTDNFFLVANNLRLGAFDGVSRQGMVRYYENSEQSESNDYLTIRKQYTPAKLTIMFDDMSNTLQPDQSMQKTEENGSIIYSNLISDVSKNSYTGLAANPYAYTDKNSLDWNSDNTAGQFFEYGMVTTNLDTIYEIRIRYGDLERLVQIKTNDVNNTISRFTQAVNTAINGGSTIDEVRFNYSSYTDIYPYSETCLYEAMYDLINDSVSAGNYHGGRITLDIRTIAPSDQTALNWVSSEWSSDARGTLGVYTLDFNVRLETVNTRFTQSNCNFTTNFNGEISSYYSYNGYYYYYQSYIPLEYQSISRPADYYITLTRDGHATYSIDNAVVRNACIINPSNTNSWNTKNLTDILSIDLMSPETYYPALQGNSNIEEHNQWMLPRNSNDSWHINIIAAVDDSMEYVGRGFNSKSSGMDYMVNLKIKMDIQSLSMSLEPLVEWGTNTMSDLQPSDFVTNSEMWYNFSTSEDKAGQTYNLAAGYANIRVWYPYGKRWITYNNISIDQGSDTRYQRLFYDLISRLSSNISIRGSDGFKLRVTFGTNAGDNFSSSYIQNSEESNELYLNYYRELPFDTSNINFYSSSSGIRMTAEYSSDNQFSTFAVTLDQYDMTRNNMPTSTPLTTSRSGSGIVTYSASAYFDYNNADCFSTRSYSTSDTNNCINNCYTRFTGYVQGGNNRFTVTPIHDGYEPQHNLLPVGSVYYSPDIWYSVSMGPSVEMSTTYLSHEDSAEITEGEWVWDDFTENAGSTYIVKKSETKGTWGTIGSFSAKFSNMNGSTVKAEWEYGFDMGDFTYSSYATAYPDSPMLSTYQAMANTADGSGKTEKQNGIEKLSLPTYTNWLNITITMTCKEGFSSVFSSDGVWTETLEVSPGSGRNSRESKSEMTSVSRITAIIPPTIRPPEGVITGPENSGSTSSGNTSDTLIPFTPRTIEYTDSTDISRNVTYNMTSGRISQCSFWEGLLNWGGANRDASSTLEVSLTLPEGATGFTLNGDFSGTITCKGDGILGSSGTRTANVSGSGAFGTNATSISMTGTYWESEFKGCKIALDDGLEGWSITSASYTRGS